MGSQLVLVAVERTVLESTPVLPCGLEPGITGHSRRRGKAVVDRDRDPDRPVETVAQRVLEAGTQPALELGPGELVRHRDDGCRLGEHHRLARGEPDPVVRGEAVEDGWPEKVELPAVGTIV